MSGTEQQSPVSAMAQWQDGANERFATVEVILVNLGETSLCNPYIEIEFPKAVRIGTTDILRWEGSTNSPVTKVGGLLGDERLIRHAPVKISLTLQNPGPSAGTDAGVPVSVRINGVPAAPATWSPAAQSPMSVKARWLPGEDPSSTIEVTLTNKGTGEVNNPFVEIKFPQLVRAQYCIHEGFDIAYDFNRPTIIVQGQLWADRARIPGGGSVTLSLVLCDASSEEGIDAVLPTAFTIDGAPAQTEA